MAGCRHSDIQRFGEIRCCLSCGEAVFETTELEDDPVESESPQYCYKPLKHDLGQEIRLIVLFAGEASDELICDIVNVNLVDRPVYEAVSYTWANAKGDVSLTSEIFCRGKVIPITKNCEAALRRLRLQSRSRRLWIDAICINQHDISEKNHQVRLMSRIYRNASQVLAYLGVEPNQVRTGDLRVISYLRNENSVLTDEQGMKENLLRFLEIPYFDRVWVLQEIGLSQLVTLIIGSHEIRWSGATILRTLVLCISLGVQAPSILRWNPASRPEEEKDIVAVLCKSRNCSATDPRDKVYALLGLLHTDFSTKIPVDYSLTPSEVFTKLAVHCIEKMKRFDIIQHCHHVPGSGGSNTRRTPTWVPQWDVKDVFEPLPAQFSEVEKQAFASSWHMPENNTITWLQHDRHAQCCRQLLIEPLLTYFASKPDSEVEYTNLSTAACRGQVCRWSATQSIHHSQWPLSPEDDEYLAQQIIHQQSQDFTCKILERDAFRASDAPANVTVVPRKLPYLKMRAHRLGSISRRLGQITNARSFHVPNTTWPALGSYYCQVCIDSNINSFMEEALKQERENLNLSIRVYGAGKAAFSTEQSVGFARGEFRLGDSVWVLYGADVPFILREVGDHYVLVGDCYLHRAGRPFPCKYCGANAASWPMQTEIIDIW